MPHGAKNSRLLAAWLLVPSFSCIETEHDEDVSATDDYGKLLVISVYYSWLIMYVEGV